MKISNSAVSGRRAPSYEEFVDLEFHRFLRDRYSPSFAHGCNSTALKVKMMEFSLWDNWAPNASKLALEIEQYRWLSTATFRCFGRLPPELRSHIWDYAIAPHREAKVHCLRERDGIWISNQPTSHFLHVCHESRAIYLQKPMVAAFQTYFNSDIDIAYIPDLEDFEEGGWDNEIIQNTEALPYEEAVADGEGSVVGHDPEVANMVHEDEDVAMEEGSESSSDEDLSVVGGGNSFERFIYSKHAKQVQILAMRKHLICDIPLEGHMASTYYEMRKAMPNWKQTVVVFEDRTSLDQAFRNIDYCFRDLSVKEKKSRAERSYARMIVKSINFVIQGIVIETMKYRWVVPNRQIETEKRVMRKFGPPAGPIRLDHLHREKDRCSCCLASP